MRKQIWIPLVVVLAACLLMLFRTKQPQRSATPQPGEALTNQPSNPEPTKAAENRPASKTARTTAVPPVVVVPAVHVEASNGEAATILAAWQTPIEFYGKVIDEKSNAVGGAQISFDWVETPTESGNRRTNTESDAEGLFSLHSQRGPNLGVAVSKEGYYPTSGGARYGPFGNPDFTPDARNPVVFQLRKKGEGASLVVMKRNYGIPRDGTPVSIDLATGATSTGENGNVVVRCWTNDQGKQSGEKYEWRCVVTVPGGGVVLTDEEFAFLAPESGYKPTAEINMPADVQGWKDDVDLKFYYRLADGRYGRMTFSMIAGGQHFCMIDSLLNPSGSRNLEPMEVKPQATAVPTWAPPGTRAVIPEFK